MPGRYQKHADYLDSLEEGALPSQTAKDKQAKSTAEFIHSLRSQGRHKRGMDDRIIASLNRHFLFLEDHPDDPNKWRIPPERVHWRDADYVMDLNSRPYHIPPRKNDPTLSLLGRATANMLSSLRDNGRLKSGMGQDLIEAIEHHGYLLVDHPRDPARWKAVRAEQEYEYDLEPAPLLQEQSHAAGQDYVSAQQSLDQTPLPATGKVEYPQEQQPLGSQSNPQSHYAPQSYYIEPPAQQPLGSQSNPQSHYAPQSYYIEPPAQQHLQGWSGAATVQSQGWPQAYGTLQESVVPNVTTDNSASQLITQTPSSNASAELGYASDSEQPTQSSRYYIHRSIGSGSLRRR